MIDILSEESYQPSLVGENADRLIVLTGCSGAGKSTLVTELRKRGFQAYEEPGRQVVKEQYYISGTALPWQDLAHFVELTVSRSIHYMVEAARRNQIAFFDRGIIDQVSGLQHAGHPVPLHLMKAAKRLRYHHKVFMLPPWREIFANDSERRHSFEDASASYQTLMKSYTAFGYENVIVPKTHAAGRADFILDCLGIS